MSLPHVAFSVQTIYGVIVKGVAASGDGFGKAHAP